MERILKPLEKYVIPLTEKIGGQRHLQAVRDGVIHTLPLILLGSFFLLAACPPGKYLESLVKPYQGLLLIPYRFTFGLIALYVCIAVAYSLARSYKMEGISTALMAGVSFFIVAVPRVSDLGDKVLCYSKTAEHALDASQFVKYLGRDGLFLGIITAIIIVEILRFLKNKKLMFTMPPGVPEGVSKAFEAIIPSFILILIFWVIRDMMMVNVPYLALIIFKPLVIAGDSIFAVIVLNLIDSVVWFAGIHPVAIISPFARPVWLDLLTANAAAAEKGLPLPHIAVDQFYYWFVWVGGSGATLGLVLIMLFVPKSKFLRQLGKMCIIPGLFGINEPLLFGLPIVANPLMIIPFAIVPLTAGIISYGAFYFNLVSRPFVAAPWTMPPPLGAYLSTGGDWRAVVLSLAVVVLSALVYYPFLKVYDRQMLEQESEAEEENEED